MDSISTKKRRDLKVRLYNLSNQLNQNYDFSLYMEMINCKRALKQLEHETIIEQENINKINETIDFNGISLDYITLLFNELMTNILINAELNHYYDDLNRLKDKVVIMYHTLLQQNQNSKLNYIHLYLDLNYYTFRIFIPKLFKSLFKDLEDETVEAIYQHLFYTSEFNLFNQQESEQLNQVLLILNVLWTKNTKKLHYHQQISYNHYFESNTWRDLYLLTIDCILTLIGKYNRISLNYRFIN